MKQHKKFLLLMAIVCSHCSISAQSIEPSTINASGLFFANTSFQVDVNIGEMTLVSTVPKPNLIVTQGLLQPTTNIADNIAENYFVNQGLTVYPNPSQNDVNIIANLDERGAVNILLTNIQGKTIFRENRLVKIGENNIKLSIAAIAEGNYLLKVKYQSSQSQTTGNQNFKIQKLN